MLKTYRTKEPHPSGTRSYQIHLHNPSERVTITKMNFSRNWQTNVKYDLFISFLPELKPSWFPSQFLLRRGTGCQNLEICFSPVFCISPPLNARLSEWVSESLWSICNEEWQIGVWRQVLPSREMMAFYEHREGELKDYKDVSQFVAENSSLLISFWHSRKNVHTSLVTHVLLMPASYCCLVQVQCQLSVLFNKPQRGC